ncbi:MAG TPA: hypothetical protein VHA33_25215 [Candidatus Angelobacter sp.]|nr:hypothetical protein [Candidatus Angelobacter sp.]
MAISDKSKLGSCPISISLAFVNAFMVQFPIRHLERNITMKKVFFLMVIVGLCSLHAYPQSTQTSASPGNNIDARSSMKGNANSKPLTLPNGITFHAELTKSLDTSKAKVGDLVSAKITEELSDGTIQIRKGSRLVGHLTKAQAYTKKNGEASLTIAFDKVILSDGQEIAFHGTMEEYRRPVLGTQGTRIASTFGGPFPGDPTITTGNRSSTMTSGNGTFSDPATRAMGRSGTPSDDPRTTGAYGNAPIGAIRSGDQPQKVTGSGFTEKSNFRLESGALIVVRVQ